MVMILGTAIERHPIPESHREAAETMRADMIEKIVENDEFLTGKIPDGRRNHR